MGVLVCGGHGVWESWCVTHTLGRGGGRGAGGGRGRGAGPDRGGGGGRGCEEVAVCGSVSVWGARCVGVLVCDPHTKTPPLTLPLCPLSTSPSTSHVVLMFPAISANLRSIGL